MEAALSPGLVSTHRHALIYKLITALDMTKENIPNTTSSRITQ